LHSALFRIGKEKAKNEKTGWGSRLKAEGAGAKPQSAISLFLQKTQKKFTLLCSQGRHLSKRESDQTRNKG